MVISFLFVKPNDAMDIIKAALHQHISSIDWFQIKWLFSTKCFDWLDLFSIISISQWLHAQTKEVIDFACGQIMWECTRYPSESASPSHVWVSQCSSSFPQKTCESFKTIVSIINNLHWVYMSSNYLKWEALYDEKGMKSLVDYGERIK